MPARKIPLVWKGQKDSDQTYFKYDPATRSVVQIGCGCITSQPTPPPPTNFQFIRVSGSQGVDPGSGNFALILINPALPLILQLNITDANSQNAASWLSTEIANCTHIKIQKDLYNYVVLNRLTSTDNTMYWEFNCTVFSSAGIVNLGDTVTITYD